MLSLSLLMYHYHCSFSCLVAKREGHVSICFLRLQSVLQFSNFSIYLMLADAGSALAGASRAKHSGKEITWENLHSHLASFSWSAEVQLHCLNALRQYLNKNKNMIKYDNMTWIIYCYALPVKRCGWRGAAAAAVVLSRELRSSNNLPACFCQRLSHLFHWSIEKSYTFEGFQVTLFLLFPPSL